MVFRNGSLDWGGGGEGGLERRTFLPDKSIASTSLSNTFKNEVGQFGLMRFSFVKMFFAYRILLTRG